MAITGLPVYKLPLEQSIRCVCGLRYLVFTGGSDFDLAACEAARDRALQMNAWFVDARIVPFMQCRCGVLLDLITVDSCELVM
ncbi:MAG TPA: hypothetical protein VF131_22890 [Blastocatellia bacterium]|nr:hypothetical protein [Blastocatellia bacterium]